MNSREKNPVQVYLQIDSVLVGYSLITVTQMYQ